MSIETDRPNLTHTPQLRFGRPSREELLSEFVRTLAERRHSVWAFQHYKEIIQNLMVLLEARRAMEIGGGRLPLFSKDELRQFGVWYAVNDISERELALAPSHVEKFCFDIAQQMGDSSQHPFGQIDLMFSHMVFEHVSDSYQAYRNIFDLLTPGGVCINFHPVLYSPPFVVNAVLPEFLSGKFLRFFFPRRNPDDTPKHPARYDRCVISKREQQALLAIGYRKVWQVPFWYHAYFEKIPGLYQLDLAITQIADRNNWNALASYCYTIVLK